MILKLCRRINTMNLNHGFMADMLTFLKGLLRHVMNTILFPVTALLWLSLGLYLAIRFTLKSRQEKEKVFMQFLQMPICTRQLLQERLRKGCTSAIVILYISLLQLICNCWKSWEFLFAYIMVMSLIFNMTFLVDTLQI